MDSNFLFEKIADNEMYKVYIDRVHTKNKRGIKSSNNILLSQTRPGADYLKLHQIKMLMTLKAKQKILLLEQRGEP